MIAKTLELLFDQLLTIKYHIYCDGYRITKTPKSYTAILTKYGSITELERQGYKLVKA